MKHKTQLVVCQDRHCLKYGAQAVWQQLKVAQTNPTVANTVHVTGSLCLGQCTHSPVVWCRRQQAEQTEQQWYQAEHPDLGPALLQALQHQQALPLMATFDPE